MTDQLAARREVDRLESTAMIASALCLIHCTLLPVAIALLPAFANMLPADELVHGPLLLLVIPLALYTLIGGNRSHRRRAPLIAGATGMILLVLGAFPFHDTPAGTMLTIAGSLSLVAAHLGNWRLRHGKAAQGCASRSGMD